MCTGSCPARWGVGTVCSGSIAGGRGRILCKDGQLLSAQEAEFLYQTRKLERAQKLQLC